MPDENVVTEKLKKLPDAPGIYLFYNSKKELIYVGKATSLKNRVTSGYFRGQRTMRPIEQMMNEVIDIKWKQTDSVLEAIILEAEYIKKFQPKYNALGKDDKSWNYITISKDAYPKVLTMRQREYSVIASGSEAIPSLKKSVKQGDRHAPTYVGARDDTFAYVFGPYPGLNTKAAMKLLRRMFRFSNCVPARQRDLSPALPPAVGRGAITPPPPQGRGQGGDSSRPCLYRQMWWCPGVCTGEISVIEYRRQVIRPLATFLSGRKKQVIKMFEREMKRAGKDERFEDAARLRDQLHSLRRIQDIALLNKSFVDTATATPPSLLLVRGGGRVSPSAREGARGERELRIEGYDISNLGAFEKVGSMVVFNEDGPVKSEYRKFIIKTVSGQSDVDSLSEVLERRFKHAEWQFPTVVLIDGGRPQVHKAVQILKKIQVAILIVGIAKGPERKRNDIILGDKSPEFIAWVSQHKDLLIQVRDEAHRFAITFHRARRGRQFKKRP